MADVSPERTARLRVHYSTAGKTHSSTLRFGPMTASGIALGHAEDIFNALAPLLYSDFTVVSCSWAEQESVVFMPVGSFEITGLLTGIRPSDTARMISASGRALSGKKATFRCFGVGLGPGDDVGDDFRVYAREHNLVGPVLSALANAPLVAPDTSPVGGWYPYVNVRYSAYWQRALRS